MVRVLLFNILFMACIKGLELPEHCKLDQFYDTGSMTCRRCHANASMVVSKDGFGCQCKDYSIPINIAQCKPCNATEVVSSDGMMCVPRHCTNIAGKLVCRKCPYDYISVTQNLDGSPLKEAQCVKCARGYKPQNNVCVKCQSCTCPRNYIIIRGTCVPRSFLNERPKYEKTELHPLMLLDIVKYEFLCSQNDIRSCRILANACVKSFYLSHPAGPCRLWLQRKITPEGLPQLIVQSTTKIKNPGEIILPRGKNTVILAVAVHTFSGGVMFLREAYQQISPCFLPVKLQIGIDIAIDCEVDISKLNTLDYSETLAPFIYMDGDLKQLPVFQEGPGDREIENSGWPINKFSRYFIMHKVRSITANTSEFIFLRTLQIRLWIERDNYNLGGLRVRLVAIAQYATATRPSVIVTSLKVEHEMPNAGIFSGLEVWGGLLGALFSLHALVQWRGVLQRGGPYISLLPLFTSAVADTLYFSAWFSTLHAFAAESSIFGLALPLSKREEFIIKAIIHCAISLKIIKVVWLNFRQCDYDIFFLDWTEYNSLKELSQEKNSNSWRYNVLAKEWSSFQTKRKTCPGYTVLLTLIIFQILKPSLVYLQGQGYKWTVISMIWWSSYCTVLLYRFLWNRYVGSPTTEFVKICAGVEVSLLVFQEEYYGHYVHGRSDDEKDMRSLSGPFSTCRIICAPQLRSVYKQLSVDNTGIQNETQSNQALLSRFLAAFFERALDGLSWIASERTVLERLLNIELTSREAGNTSVLLYDDDKTPSCFAVTWMGEEWSLATFDAMLFGSILVATNDVLTAALVTIVVWQIIKFGRQFFGNRNLKRKTHVDLI